MEKTVKITETQDDLMEGWEQGEGEGGGGENERRERNRIYKGKSESTNMKGDEKRENLPLSRLEQP